MMIHIIRDDREEAIDLARAIHEIWNVSTVVVSTIHGGQGGTKRVFHVEPPGQMIRYWEERVATFYTDEEE